MDAITLLSAGPAATSTHGTALVGQFLQYMCMEKDASPYTVKSYRSDLAQFGQFLLGRIGRWGAGAGSSADDIGDKLLQCGPLTIGEFQSYLEDQNYTGSSISRKLATLRSFYKFLVRSDMVTVNPLASIQLPHVEMRAPKCLDPGQVRALLDAPGYGTVLSARDSAILELLYSTGMRVSEMVELKMPDLDLQAAIVHIHGRRPTDRLLPISPQAVRALQRYSLMRPRQSKPGEAPGDRVLGRSGDVLILRRKLDKYVALAGLPADISPSTLRHSFAVQMLNEGVDLRRVKELLGYRNLTSAQIYQRLAARARAENPPAAANITAIPHRPRAA